MIPEKANKQNKNKLLKRRITMGTKTKEPIAEQTAEQIAEQTTVIEAEKPLRVTMNDTNIIYAKYIADRTQKKKVRVTFNGISSVHPANTGSIDDVIVAVNSFITSMNLSGNYSLAKVDDIGHSFIAMKK